MPAEDREILICDVATDGSVLGAWEHDSHPYHIDRYSFASVAEAERFARRNNLNFILRVSETSTIRDLSSLSVVVCRGG